MAHTAIPIEFDECWQAYYFKSFRGQRMTRKGHNTWTSAQVKHYTCNFRETTTVHYPRLTLTEFPAALEGDDPYIHQALTQTRCEYKKSYCIPQEYPHSKVIWPKVKHDSRLYHLMGIFPVKQIDNYFLIPTLGIGGSSIDKDEIRSLNRRKVLNTLQKLSVITQSNMSVQQNQTPNETLEEAN